MGKGMKDNSLELGLSRDPLDVLEGVFEYTRSLLHIYRLAMHEDHHTVLYRFIDGNVLDFRQSLRMGGPLEVVGLKRK